MPPSTCSAAWQLTPQETEIAMKVLAEMALMTPEQLDALNDVSVRQWVAQHGELPRPLFSFLAVQSNLMATGLYELVALWELAKIMQIIGGSTDRLSQGRLLEAGRGHRGRARRPTTATSSSGPGWKG